MSPVCRQSTSAAEGGLGARFGRQQHQATVAAAHGSLSRLCPPVHPALPTHPSGSSRARQTPLPWPAAGASTHGTAAGSAHAARPALQRRRQGAGVALAHRRQPRAPQQAGFASSALALPHQLLRTHCKLSPAQPWPCRTCARVAAVCVRDPDLNPRKRLAHRAWPPLAPARSGGRRQRRRPSGQGAQAPAHASSDATVTEPCKH